MKDKDKVVNTEEQNRAVNPGDSDYQETSSQEQPINKKNINPSEKEKPDGGSEVERLHRTGEEDADNTEKKNPDM